eukprot:Opistho-2@62622
MDWRTALATAIRHRQAVPVTPVSVQTPDIAIYSALAASAGHAAAFQSTHAIMAHQHQQQQVQLQQQQFQMHLQLHQQQQAALALETASTVDMVDFDTALGDSSADFLLGLDEFMGGGEICGDSNAISSSFPFDGRAVGDVGAHSGAADSSSGRGSPFSAGSDRVPSGVSSVGSPQLLSGQRGSSYSPTDPSSNVAPDQRRSSHIAAEQKRRNNIKEGFNELRDVVPACRPHDSKAVILKKAGDYILYLKKKKAERGEIDEGDELRRRMKFAIEYIACLKRQKGVLVEQIGRAKTELSRASRALAQCTCTPDVADVSAKLSATVDAITTAASGSGDSADLDSRIAARPTTCIGAAAAAEPLVCARTESVEAYESDSMPDMASRVVQDSLVPADGPTALAAKTAMSPIVRMQTQEVLPSGMKLLVIMVMFVFAVMNPPEQPKNERGTMIGMRQLAEYFEGTTTTTVAAVIASYFTYIVSIFLRIVCFCLAAFLSWRYILEAPSSVQPNSRRFNLALEERRKGTKRLIAARCADTAERHFINALTYFDCSAPPSSRLGLAIALCVEIFVQITHMMKWGQKLARYSVTRSGAEVTTEECAKTYLSLNQLYFANATDVPLEGWVCLLKAINFAESTEPSQTLAKAYSILAFQLAFRLGGGRITRRPLGFLARMYRRLAAQTGMQTKVSEQTRGYISLLDAWEFAACGDVDAAASRFEKASIFYADCGLKLMAWEARVFQGFALAVHGRVRDSIDCVRKIQVLGLDDGTSEQTWWTRMCLAACLAHEESIVGAKDILED